MFTIRLECNMEPGNKSASLSQATHLVGFELGTYPFDWGPSPTRSLYLPNIKIEHQKRKYRDITEKIMIFHFVLTEVSSCLRILYNKSNWQITKSLQNYIITKLKVQIPEVLRKSTKI